MGWGWGFEFIALLGVVLILLALIGFVHPLIIWVIVGGSLYCCRCYSLLATA